MQEKDVLYWDFAAFFPVRPRFFFDPPEAASFLSFSLPVG